jgi:hypothetical protein
MSTVKINIALLFAQSIYHTTGFMYGVIIVIVVTVSYLFNFLFSGFSFLTTTSFTFRLEHMLQIILLVHLYGERVKLYGSRVVLPFSISLL